MMFESCIKFFVTYYFRQRTCFTYPNIKLVRGGIKAKDQGPWAVALCRRAGIRYPDRLMERLTADSHMCGRMREGWGDVGNVEVL